MINNYLLSMIQQKLNQIKKFYYRYKRLPSYSEMLRLFNLSSKKSIHDIIYKLIDNGLLKKQGKKLAPTSKFFSLPVLGTVKAGFPIMADEVRDYLSLDDYLIEDPRSSFLLKVSGDSLIEAGIYDGDYVIIEKNRQPINGDIVLAEVDKEWTLKILKKNRRTGKLYLQPANSKYPPIYPKYSLEIFGVVKAVIRKLIN